MHKTMEILRSATYRTGHIYRQFTAGSAWRQFRAAGQRYRASPIRIALRALRLYWLGRFTPDESLSKGLVDPSVPLDRHQEYFSDERLNGLQDAINSPNSGMCRDKLLFHAYCRQHVLPVTELLAIVSPNGSRSQSNQQLVANGDWVKFIIEQLPVKFILKPRNGNKGRDVRLAGIGTDQEPGAAMALAKELQALESGEDWLLEKRIEVHESIKNLTGTSAVSCVRMVTVIDNAGRPKILGAYFRTIVGDSVTDNISDFRTGKFSGNILAMPDLITGKITSAYVSNTDGVGCMPVTTHPKTGVDIVGFEIPGWNRVRDVACAAALAFVPIRTVGWDIAISSDGPVLVEANERYRYSAWGEHVRGIRSALLHSLPHQ